MSRSYYIQMMKQKDERITELEKERATLTEDLLETESNLASLQSKFEDIETVFCDEDGCLIIEPFNGEELSKWYKSLKAGN
jgi:predicted nuclease with TOPRIM domain